MKKIIPLFIMLLLLCGCSVKNYTPEIPVDMEENITVTSGDFSYDCKFCKNSTKVVVLVTSTYAKGMQMVYDGENLSFAYHDYPYEFDADSFDNSNPAKVLFQVFKNIENNQQISASKIDGGYKYQGSIPLGDYVLIQNDDNSVKQISFKNTEYVITFNEK